MSEVNYAFPVLESADDSFKSTTCMTLRDYFAGQAITGMIISSAIHQKTNMNLKKYSEISYVIADAMIATRDVPKEDQK